MAYLTVKNWADFQHYKDRSPPWIKLHRELLRDYDFSCLQDASKLHLILIWLLASQLDNKIPNDAAWIQRQIGVSEQVDVKSLINSGFIILVQDASEALAERKQSAMLETEAEAEKEKSNGSSAKPINPFADEFSELWKMYPKRSGSNPKNKALQAYGARRKEGTRHEDIRDGLARYVAWCTATGKIGTETVMQAQRFFGKGTEWENEFIPPPQKVKLPTDNQSLWAIRTKRGMDPFYEDLATCHREILEHMQQHPEVSC